MIYSLPLDLNNVDLSQKIEIDLSKTDKTKFTNLYRMTLIYLRNLDIPDENLKLHFDNVSYDEKCKYLLEYIQSDILLSIDELNSTIVQLILVSYDKYDYSLSSILSKQDAIQFCNTYHHMIQYLSTVYFSTLIFFGIIINPKVEKTYTVEKISLDEVFSKNIFNIYKYINKIEFLLIKNNYYILYKKYFSRTFINNYLNKYIKYSKMLTLFYGMTTDKWNKFVSLLQY